jgi:excisionase family DNA binding protein
MYEDIISIQSASKLLGVSRTQVYRLLDCESIMEVDIDGKRLVRKSSVYKYLQLKVKIEEIKQMMKVH